jgi:hypothetical protein
MIYILILTWKLPRILTIVAATCPLRPTTERPRIRGRCHHLGRLALHTRRRVLLIVSTSQPHNTGEFSSLSCR